MLRPILFLCICVVLSVGLFACDVLPNANPTPSRQISYDGPVTLTIKAGETLPGTTVGYQGKAPDGRAMLSLNGTQALKATADSVNWTGALILFSLVDLKMRVVTFDEKSLTLAGTIHLVVQEPNPVAGNLSPNVIAAYTIPVTYTVDRNTTLPGTNVAYLGAKTGGAEFANLDQFPFRERFDSVVWQGHLRDRIALRLDLRVLDFNDDRAVLGGTARIVFEQ
jgi:hypothetical protein